MFAPMDTKNVSPMTALIANLRCQGQQIRADFWQKIFDLIVDKKYTEVLWKIKGNNYDDDYNEQVELMAEEIIYQKKARENKIEACTCDGLLNRSCPRHGG